MPEAVLAGVESGVISCDRHGAYKKFARLHPGIMLSFCWAHQRRDFLTLANDYPPLAEWAMSWVDRIGELFKLYDERAEAAPRSLAYRRLHGKLRSGLRTMARERHRALADRELSEPARKLMQSMQRHWRGLREFVHHREVPPDNNSAERALRGPVVGRNYPRVVIMRGSRLESAESPVRRRRASAGRVCFSVGAIAALYRNCLTSRA